MSGYVVACYSITIGALGAYAAWVIAKYRAVNKRDDA
jgi:hypothetical protein